jgi:hypothetical protein
MSYELTYEGVTASVTLDVSTTSSRNVIKAKQNDISRMVKISIVENGDTLKSDLPYQASKATLRVQRPDGKLLELEQSMSYVIQQIDGEDVWVLTDQVFTLTPEMLSVAGRAYCDCLLSYSIIKLDAQTFDYEFSTEGFYIDIEPAPTDKSNVYDTPYNETQAETASDYVREVTS